MSDLPYSWKPAGVRYQPHPAVGDVFPMDHAVWVVTEVLGTVKSAGGAELTAFRYQPHPAPADTDPDRPEPLAAYAWPGHWRRYDDGHYPVCATCQEPVPCRHVTGEKVAAEAAVDLDRHSTAGVCPACQETVTSRQESLTYPDNAVLMLGPPVTYHVRSACRPALMRYDARWAAVTGRAPLLACPGVVVVHVREYECSENVDCPGLFAKHRAVHPCPDCLPNGGTITRRRADHATQRITGPDGFTAHIARDFPTEAPAATPTGDPAS